MTVNGKSLENSLSLIFDVQITELAGDGVEHVSKILLRGGVIVLVFAAGAISVVILRLFVDGRSEGDGVNRHAFFLQRFASFRKTIVEFCNVHLVFVCEPV